MPRGRPFKPNPDEKGQTKLPFAVRVPPSASPDSDAVLNDGPLDVDDEDFADQSDPVLDPPEPALDPPEPQPAIVADPVDLEPLEERAKLDGMSLIQRKNVEHYLSTFRWAYMTKPGIVHCGPCQKYQRHNKPSQPTVWSSGFEMSPRLPFTLNSGHWRANTFNMHQKSKEHERAVTTPPPVTPPIDKALKSLFRGANAPTKRAIAVTLFTVQEEMPIRKAEKIHELFVVMLSGETSGYGLLFARHRSNWSKYQFMKALNEDVQQRQLQRLRDCFAFTLHADESTDLNDQKFLLLYVQYVNVVENGETQVHFTEFLTVLKVPNGRSETITRKITSFFAKSNVDIKKMVMFTSDGAAVMLGKKNGVAARLRTVVGPHLIDYHCICHREALGMRDAYHDMPYFLALDSDLRSLISFLARGKTRDGMEKLCEALELDYVEIPKIIEIRWLCRIRTLNALIIGYPAILEYCESAAGGQDIALHGHADTIEQQQARGFLQSFGKFQRIWIIHRLGDLLEPYDLLNRFTQNKKLHPYQVRQQTDQVIQTLRDRYRLVEVPQSSENEVSTTLEPQIWEGPNITLLKKRLSEDDDHGIRIRPTEPECQWTALCRQADRLVYQLAQKLAKQLELRCGSGTESEILKETSIFDPVLLTKYSAAGGSTDQYGADEISHLCDRYGDFTGIDEDELLREWRDVMRKIYYRLTHFTGSEWHSILSCITDRPTTYPNLVKVARIIMAFNAQNAEVERGFSDCARLKSKIRNRIKRLILDVLLRLKNVAEHWSKYFAEYDTVLDIWIANAEGRGRYGIGQRVNRPTPRARHLVHAVPQSQEPQPAQPDPQEAGTSGSVHTDALEEDLEAEFFGFDQEEVAELERFIRELDDDFAV